VFAAFVVAEPRFAPAPVIVPERTSLDERAPVLELPETSRLGPAIESAAYSDELRRRRRLLAPEGRWATWWAKHFHGWPMPDDEASVAAAAAGAAGATGTGGGQSAR